MKQNLKKCSDDELSLVVFNTEYLYNLRFKRFVLRQALDEEYTFTAKQYAILKEDIEADRLETIKFNEKKV